jgi:hypothetical protein
MRKSLFLLISALLGAAGAAAPSYAADLELPTVGVVSPAINSYLNVLSTVSGTAGDNVAVSTIELRINSVPDNYFWNGSAWTAAEAWLPVSFLSTGTVNWSYSALPAWFNGFWYRVSARAVDTSGNWTGIYSTALFYFDTAAPVSAVTSPAPFSDLQTFDGLAGTASDNEFGPAQVWAGVRRQTDGYYWNGATSKWTGSQVWNLAVGSVTWTYSGPPETALTRGTTYFAFTKAADLAGNVQVSLAGSTFTYSGALGMQPPSVAVLQPPYGSVLSSLPQITGTSADDVAIASVTVSVYDNQTGQYWNGSAWSASQAWAPASLQASSWTFTAVPGWVDWSTYTVYARSMDTAGNWSIYPSSSVFMFLSDFVTPPGCAHLQNVLLSGAGGKTSVQAAVNALPASFSGDACVVLRDAGTYAEQVTVRNFAVNGHRLKIMADPSFVSSSPVVSPPALSTAAFLLQNDGVTLRGIRIAAPSSLPYGVLSSSAALELDRVSVLYGPGISAAGVSASSGTVISASDISVQDAFGLLLKGQGSAVTGSTVSAESQGYYAAHLSGVTGSTFSAVNFRNPPGMAVFVSSGSRGNLIDRAGIVSDSNAAGVFGALYLRDSSSNTVSDSVISNVSGAALYLGIGADANVILRSTMTSSLTGYQALRISGGSGNAVTGCYMYSEGGYGLLLGNNSPTERNTVSASTITSDSPSLSAADFRYASNNTLSGNLIYHPAGHGVEIEAGSYGNTLSSNLITGNSAGKYAVSVNGVSSNTVADCVISNPPGYGVQFLGGASHNLVLRSTIAVNSVYSGYGVDASSFNALAESYVSNPSGYGALIGYGAASNLVSSSTLRSASASHFALKLVSASSNTVSDSLLSNPAGTAYTSVFGYGNALARSTAASSAAPYPAAFLDACSGETVTASLLRGAGALHVRDSSFTAVSHSVLAATAAAGIGLRLDAPGTFASSFNDISSPWAGIELNAGASGAVSFSSDALRGAVYGLRAYGPAAGGSLRLDSVAFLPPASGATGISFLGGTLVSSFTALNFGSTGTAVNVDAALLQPGSYIYIDGLYGPRYGPTYETDPGGYVDWAYADASAPAGCAQAVNVRKDGAGDFTGLQAAVNALKRSLAGDACVLVRDGGTYAEQVAVRGFVNNGYRIRLLAGPALGGPAPALAPPAASTAAFLLAADSVTLQGFRIEPSSPLPYGVFSSSDALLASSLALSDPGGNIYAAGVRLGGRGGALTASTVAVFSASADGVLLDGASSAAVRGVLVSNPGGGRAMAIERSTGARVSASGLYGSGFNGVYYGADYLSALRVKWSEGSAIEDCAVENSALHGVGVSVENSGDTLITGSTVTAASLVLNISDSWRSAVRRSGLYGGDEMTGVYLNGGGSNLVERSAVSCSAGGVCLGGGVAVLMEGGTGDAVRDSYLHSGFSGAVMTGSPGALLASNLIVSGSGAADGAVSFNGGHGTRIASNTITGLLGISVAAGAETLTLDANVVSGALTGAKIAASGTDLRVSSLTFAGLLPGATAVSFDASSLVSTFSFVNFDSTGIAVNVDGSGLQAGSRVTMLGFTGFRGGEAYETDPAGRVDWPGDDIAPPAAAVLQPAGGAALNLLPQISGTSADNVGVSSVVVSVRALGTGLYWDGAAWAAGQAWLNAAATGYAWGYEAVPAWVTDSSYTVTARAIDAAGNWSAPAEASFLYDATPPLSAVTQPPSVLSTTFTAISGTAYDLDGVTQVLAGVKRLRDSVWWNGAAWVSTETWVPASGTASWTYTGLSTASLSHGATYHFLSKAYDRAGNASDPYNILSTFTFVVPPEGVFSTAPFSGASDAGLTVNWGTTYPAGKIYHVRLATHPAESPYVGYATTTANAMAFGGLAPDSRYYGFVSTLPASGYFAAGSGLTHAAAPSSAAFSAVGYSTAVLSWAAPANPAWTVYRYEIALSSSFSVIAGSGSVAGSSAALAGLAQGATYYGRVAAYNGDGVPSVPAYAAPAVTMMLLPTGLPAPLAGSTLGTGSIMWSWARGSVANAGYLSYYADGVPVGTATVSAPGAYIQAGLTPNTSHQLGVAGRNANGEGPLALSSAVYTLAAAPSGLAAAQVLITSASLSWGANGNRSGTLAELWRSTDNAGFYPVFTGPALAYADAALQECSPYYYKARNRNGAGVYTAFTPAIGFVTQASTPTPPSGLYAEALNGARIALTWDLSPWPGVTEYRLYYDSGTGTVDYAAPLAVLPSTAAAWTTPQLQAGTVYRFALRARNRCGMEEANTAVAASAQAVGVLSGVRAVIKAPQTGKKIRGNTVAIVAEIALGLPSQIARVRFQYRLQGAFAWTSVDAVNANHPNPDAEAPYFTHWDADAMAPGTYELRALASDVYGADDPAPPTITVTIDPVDYDTRETVVGGELQKEQKINNAVTSTVQAADEATALVSKVVIPAGAVSVDTVAVTLVSNPASKPAPPEGSEELNLAVKVNLSNSQSALSGGSSASVTLNYKDDNNDGRVDGSNAPVERLKMFSAPDGGGDWTEMSTSVDREKKTVTGVTTHFSFFSVFAAPSASLGGVKAYPNPWQPGSGGRFDAAAGVTFANVPTGGRIKIFTIMGELVRALEVSAADANTKVWDGRNTDGHKAASGVYIVLVKSGSTERTLKVAVER